jgi:hypothetical protein
MFRLLPRRFQRRSRLAGLLIAAFAMASQVAVGAMTTPVAPSGQVAALAALSVLCHGQPPAPDRPAPPRHVPLAALCPLGFTLTLPVAILSPSAGLPTPPAALALRIAPTPPARAPPAQMALTAYPRGPPVPA